MSANLSNRDVASIGATFFLVFSLPLALIGAPSDLLSPSDAAMAHNTTWAVTVVCVAVIATLRPQPVIVAAGVVSAAVVGGVFALWGLLWTSSIGHSILDFLRPVIPPALVLLAPLPFFLFGVYKLLTKRINGEEQ